jgi:hypothetical protein
MRSVLNEDAAMLGLTPAEYRRRLGLPVVLDEAPASQRRPSEQSPTPRAAGVSSSTATTNNSAPAGQGEGA